LTVVDVDEMNAHPDVLCVGQACYDLTFSVDHHPQANEKTTARSFLGCGGGPASNAALTVARMGFSVAFAGYLGRDIYGQLHNQELIAEHVDTHLLQRGEAQTPISAILVKPDGARALVNYMSGHRCQPRLSPGLYSIHPETILFDGHEPDLAEALIERARQLHIPMVLDAGSLHAGTEQLYREVDYLVCSEKFAVQISANNSVERSLELLAECSPCVVITLGERGLIWRRGSESGCLPAFAVDPVDTTGAGDVFHGAFAAGLSAGYAWHDLLRLASAAGALCCTRTGARPSIPTMHEIDAFLAAR
jgi:sulfofructose kinase